MRKIQSEGTIMALTGAFLVVLLLLGSGVALAQTSTAQSAMFSNGASGTFFINGTEVWEYDRDVAATYFSNTLVSGPVITCSGNATNCGAGNQPATPTAPDPDQQKLVPFVSSNSCNFWDGSALALNPLPQDNQYKQSETIKGVNGNGNWKFEWTYEIGFADPDTSDSYPAGGPFPAMTAWELQSSDTASAEVGVEGFFAGQSTQKKNKGGADKWTFKASHTMTASDLTSRLVTPQYTIEDANGAVCGPTDIVMLPIESGVDFIYDGNAGSNGTLSQLFDDPAVAGDGKLVSLIQQGGVAAVNGLFDNFAGNDSTNGERQSIDADNTPTCSIADAGSYTLNVTGTLKGVSGASSLPVSISSTVCISAGTCQLCP
jgi:hypothetical protein